VRPRNGPTIGIVGVGRMGGNLAQRALDVGIQVVGFRRSGISAALQRKGVQEASSLRDLVKRLHPPRIVLLYVPAGRAVDRVLRGIVPHLARGDLVADGGNSYWGDSMRRYSVLAKRKIQFLDVGTSGGIPGARNGACFMVGGTRRAFERIRPIVTALAVDKRGVVHCGPAGTGHFVKLVHNGIEFGMMQAIGEGVALLRAHEPRLDVLRILENWNHGSVIRSWLLEVLADEASSPSARAKSTVIEDTGEVNWLIDDALRMEVPIPVIAQSVMQLVVSRDSEQAWAHAVAQMRHGFGGHPYGRSRALARERRTSRRRGRPPRTTRTGWPLPDARRSPG
jgi:6-phosphogluconate dehydrogenase